MSEPFFESRFTSAGSEAYPFECFISDTRGERFLIKPHWHYYIELLYCLAGQAGIFLAGKRHTFGAGDMVLINSREVHSIFAEKGTHTKYIVVKFEPEVLYTTTRSVFESKYILPFILSKSGHQKVFPAADIAGTPVPALAEQIYSEFGGRSFGFELAVRTHICNIFLWVLRSWHNKGFRPDTGNALMKEINLQRLQKILDYLDAHYPEDISTGFAAKLCNMSYSYFSRHFKEIMGKTFTEYLNYVRVIEAEKLLLTTDINITQAGLQTGFSNTSYFIKQFRHFKNVSPKQYRKRVMEEKEDAL